MEQAFELRLVFAGAHPGWLRAALAEQPKEESYGYKKLFG